MLMFRLKEVLPIEKKVFWEDLGVTRRIYQRRALLQVVKVDDNEAKDVEPSGTGEMRGEDINDEEEVNEK